MFGRFSRGLLGISLVAVLAGCNSTSPTDGLAATNASGAQAQAQAPAPAVVQAYCPPVVIPEQGAVYRSYAKGGPKKAAPVVTASGAVADNQQDPQSLLFQASLADVTRQCTANETTMTINIVAQGRLVQGAAGAPGRVTLPMLVEIIDGDTVISSQKVAFPVDMAAGGSQFIFNKSDLQMPVATGGISRFTRVRLGFDLGGPTPAKKPGKKA